MHRTPTLTLLAFSLLLRTTTAFVPFAHTLHPNIDMATVSPPTALPLTPTPDSHSASPASTPSSVSEPTPSLSLNEEPSHIDLKERQGPVVTAPAAVLPIDPDQISPITTVEVDSYPPGGGAPVKIPLLYTQTFALVPEQWEAAGVGSIGMGTIVGEIGRVKTKRFVPFVVESQDVAEGGMVMTASTFTA